MRKLIAASTKVRPDTSRRRALVIAFMLTAWMLTIGARLVYLQISQHDWLERRAQAQQQDVIEVSPVRGLVLDRQGRELARSVDVESFFAVPGEVENIEEAATRLSPVLAVDHGEIEARLREAGEAHRKFVWVARKLEAARAEKIHELKLAGIHSVKESKRFYPNGELAAHVLGFVGLDEVGLAGVEQVYNGRIRGEAGKLFLEADAHRHAYESYEVQSRPGQAVELSLDQMVQYRTERALASALERTRAKSGSAIVLDPHTGEILALASAPTFDPNDARNASPRARLNGALQNIYEPGSTFKIIVYAAAIERGLVRPEDHVDCQMGSITVAGRLIHDHHPFGSLTIASALAQSSNVAAIKLGLRVGDASMYDYITRFGFGARTGVELPGETAGLVRAVGRWQPSSIGSVAMGQEVGVTPVQMAAAFAALANDGVRVAPHLVREIRDPDGSVLFRAAPERRRVISTETARTLRGMLEGVTLNGTAKRAQLDGYTAAGKTGTAQKIDPKTKAYSKTRYVGSFAGFAPVEDPAVVIIVVIDEPVGAYHGGDVAAPVFREIAEQILPDLNVAPDTTLKSAPDLIAQTRLAAEAVRNAREEIERENEERQGTMPQEVAPGDARRATGEVVYALATKHAVLMPDLRGRSLRDTARVCAQLGLRLEARGEGRALWQTPAAGAEVDAGQIVRIDFGGGG